ncbi:MAG: polyphosphate--glucose phosphotransferase [Chloroflexota bacterium]
MQILGIDIGGSGIKGAVVDVEKGAFKVQRHRIPTPQPATPEEVAAVVNEIVEHFKWKGPIGCTFPAVVKHGVIHTAANVDDSWIGVNAQRLLQRATGCPVTILNDADAAGVAEMTFGAGVGHDGIVFILTFGTGIGSCVYVDGSLMPNTELGHLKIRGKIAEHRASDKIRQDKDLSWKKWAKRVTEYLQYVEFLFSPDLIIFGGGVSKNHGKFFHRLDTQAQVVPAQLLNDAGIVGAALAAKALV